MLGACDLDTVEAIATDFTASLVDRLAPGATCGSVPLPPDFAATLLAAGPSPPLSAARAPDSAWLTSARRPVRRRALLRTRMCLSARAHHSHCIRTGRASRQGSPLRSDPHIVHARSHARHTPRERGPPPRATQACSHRTRSARASRVNLPSTARCSNLRAGGGVRIRSETY